MSKSLILSRWPKLQEHEIISRLMSTEPDYVVPRPNPQTVFDQNCEADVKTVALGQLVPGTGFRLGTLQDIWYWWYPHILAPVKLRSIEFETMSRSRQTEIRFTARDIKRGNMAWRAVRICREKLREKQLAYNDEKAIPFPNSCSGNIKIGLPSVTFSKRRFFLALALRGLYTVVSMH